MMNPPNLGPRYEYSGNCFEGGQAVGYCFHDKFLGRKVLAKVFHDIENEHELRSEISALALIKSKHVVRIYDVIVSKGQTIGVIEEFLPSEDLCELNISDSTHYVRTLYQIANGILDIHEHNCIHRDLKLTNMKFDSEGLLKIFDFGFASVDEPNPKTKSGRGSDVYRAPELYSLPTNYDSSVDVYAFGVIAWRLTDMSVPRALKENPPLRSGPAPSIGSSPLVPKSLVEILDACLAPNPRNRPSIADVCRKLREHLLKNKHRGLLVYEDKTLVIDAKTPGVNLTIGAAKARLTYDGSCFSIEPVIGTIEVNASTISGKKVLPPSCVISLLAPTGSWFRNFITFDISHPEVF